MFKSYYFIVSIFISIFLSPSSEASLGSVKLIIEETLIRGSPLLVRRVPGIRVFSTKLEDFSGEKPPKPRHNPKKVILDRKYDLALVYNSEDEEPTSTIKTAYLPGVGLMGKVIPVEETPLKKKRSKKLQRDPHSLLERYKKEEQELKVYYEVIDLARFDAIEEVALNMLDIEAPDEDIMRITNLSAPQVLDLKSGKRLKRPGSKGGVSEHEASNRFALGNLNFSLWKMLSDEEVRLSFIRTFTKDERIEEVLPFPETSTIFDTLKTYNQEERRDLPYMSFVCRPDNAENYIVQIHLMAPYFEYSLSYIARAYSQQKLMTVGISILNYETGELTTPEDYEHHYMMTDKMRPRARKPFIQLRQIELPRVNLGSVKDSLERQWLQVLRSSEAMEEISRDFDPSIQKALKLLDKYTWPIGELSEYRIERYDLVPYSGVITESRSDALVEMGKKLLEEGELGSLVEKITGFDPKEL